jgi:hypothetical protein
MALWSTLCQKLKGIPSLGNLIFFQYSNENPNKTMQPPNPQKKKKKENTLNLKV